MKKTLYLYPIFLILCSLSILFSNLAIATQDWAKSFFWAGISLFFLFFDKKIFTLFQKKLQFSPKERIFKNLLLLNIYIIFPPFIFYQSDFYSKNFLLFVIVFMICASMLHFFYFLEREEDDFSSHYLTIWPYLVFLFFLFPFPAWSVLVFLFVVTILDFFSISVKNIFQPNRFRKFHFFLLVFWFFLAFLVILFDFQVPSEINYFLILSGAYFYCMAIFQKIFPKLFSPTINNSQN